VTKVIGVEPEPGMLQLARKAAAEAPVPVEIIAESAEALGVPERSVDSVLVTYSLCTIPDPVAALEAARHALKPEGRLYFCEHGVAPKSSVRRLQRRVEPVWKRIAGGCRLSRDIPAIVRKSGFTIVEMSERFLPRTPAFVGYTYRGVASPR
jgi:ubiquinone/menaquinone biosynthesis C-methylase UbiE